MLTVQRVISANQEYIPSDYKEDRTFPISRKLGFILVEACRREENALALWLIANSADVNQSDEVLVTSLMCATGNKQRELVKALLAKGANPNARTINGETALHCCHDLPCAKMLIEHGAMVDVPCDNGYTPLMLTTNVEVAKLLIQKGSDFGRTSMFGATPITRPVVISALKSLIQTD